MKHYRITKYNPAKRNTDGSYNDDREWTAISDIGIPNYGSISYSDYKKIEDGYVYCTTLLMEHFNVTEFTAEDVTNFNTDKNIEKCRKDSRLRDLNVDFKKDIKPVVENATILGTRLEFYTRMCLRELFQMRLVSSTLIIEFGFDYYMYVSCPKIPKNIIDEIERNWVYVEVNVARKKFILK